MESVQEPVKRSEAVYPLAGKTVANDLEKHCLPDVGQCEGLKNFFFNYDKAVSAYYEN